MRAAHLSDDRLVELYFTDTPSAREQQHLGHCHDCETRRASIAHLLDETAQAATEDVEAVFPAQRLARQQVQILERVEAMAGPARVIAFPAGSATNSTGLAARTRPTTRWVAAAAVAGLVVGLVAGRAGRELAPSARATTIRASADRAGTVALTQARAEAMTPLRAIPVAASADDFLVEIAHAIESRSAGSLHALDALTPRAGELPTD